jgi:hypothetical protein
LQSAGQNVDFPQSVVFADRGKQWGAIFGLRTIRLIALAKLGNDAFGRSDEVSADARKITAPIAEHRIKNTLGNVL